MAVQMLQTQLFHNTHPTHYPMQSLSPSSEQEERTRQERESISLNFIHSLLSSLSTSKAMT